MKGALLILAALALAACSSTDPVQGAEPATFPSPTASSAAPLRSAKLGEPFDIPRWKVTVTKVRCGDPKELDVDAAGTDRAPRVCVADFTYTNTGTEAARFNQNADGLDFTPYRGFDAAGRSYDATTWMQPVTNPGLSGTNQLVINVGPDVTLTAVQIADVKVSL